MASKNDFILHSVSACVLTWKNKFISESNNELMLSINHFNSMRNNHCDIKIYTLQFLFSTIPV